MSMIIGISGKYDTERVMRGPAATVKITQQYKQFGTEYPELLL